MKSRAMLAVVVLSTALVSGGWLVERGLVGSQSTIGAAGDRARLFDQVLERVARDYVDTLSDSTLYAKAVDGQIEVLPLADTKVKLAFMLQLFVDEKILPIRVVLH